MNDYQRIDRLKLWLHLVKQSKTVMITTGDLQWLIFQAEIVRDSAIAQTQQRAVLLKIYGKKLDELQALLMENQ